MYRQIVLRSGQVELYQVDFCSAFVKREGCWVPVVFLLATFLLKEFSDWPKMPGWLVTSSRVVTVLLSVCV